MHSMSDLFEARPDLVEPRLRVWDKLHELGDRITPLLLTKRSDVMADWARKYGWPAGAWAGVTVESQPEAKDRLRNLLRIEAPHFVSCEPLLGSLQLTEIGWSFGVYDVLPRCRLGAALRGSRHHRRHARPLGDRWRRVRPACATDSSGLAAQPPGPVQGRRGALLPQAVGHLAARSG